MTPLTVVLRLLLPTVSWFEPRKKLPAPAIEPALILPSLAGPAVLEKSTVPPALAMNCALPPLLLSLNCVSPPLFVVMVALEAVLLLLNKSPPPLLVMMAFPAELLLLQFRFALLVKLGANAELLTMPAPLMLKVIPVPLVMKLKAGAPAVNRIVLIEASSEIVTDVGAPLLVNVAVLSGTVAGLQLLSWVHSLGTGAPLPVQVPSSACPGCGASVARATRETPASSAGHVRATGGADAAVSNGAAMALRIGG